MEGMWESKALDQTIYRLLIGKLNGLAERLLRFGFDRAPHLRPDEQALVDGAA